MISIEQFVDKNSEVHLIIGSDFCSFEQASNTFTVDNHVATESLCFRTYALNFYQMNNYPSLDRIFD